MKQLPTQNRPVFFTHRHFTMVLLLSAAAALLAVGCSPAAEPSPDTTQMPDSAQPLTEQIIITGAETYSLEPPESLGQTEPQGNLNGAPLTYAPPLRYAAAPSAHLGESALVTDALSAPIPLPEGFDREVTLALSVELWGGGQ